jgi:hypothetical protein
VSHAPGAVVSRAGAPSWMVGQGHAGGARGHIGATTHREAMKPVAL